MNHITFFAENPAKHMKFYSGGTPPSAVKKNLRTGGGVILDPKKSRSRLLIETAAAEKSLKYFLKTGSKTGEKWGVATSGPT